MFANLISFESLLGMGLLLLLGVALGVAIFGSLAEALRDLYWRRRNRQAIAGGEEALPEHLLVPGALSPRSRKATSLSQRRSPNPHFRPLRDQSVNEPTRHG